VTVSVKLEQALLRALTVRHWVELHDCICLQHHAAVLPKVFFKICCSVPSFVAVYKYSLCMRLARRESTVISLASTTSLHQSAHTASGVAAGIALTSWRVYATVSCAVQSSLLYREIQWPALHEVW
jgi:hypothetical protein